MEILLYFAQGRFRSRAASESEAIEDERAVVSDLPRSTATPDNSQEVLARREVQLLRAPRVVPVHNQLYSRRIRQMDWSPDSSSQDVPVNQNSSRVLINENPQHLSLDLVEEQRDSTDRSLENRGRSLSASDADSYQRLSLREQIARVVLDFSRPYRNTRAQNRQRLIAKTVLESLSPANPAAFISFATDDSAKPSKFDVILQMADLSEEQVQQFAWNPDDSSPNIIVKMEDQLTFHRNPVPQSTDGIRGKVGFSRGFHVWKITWPTEQRGTHPFVGVATKEASLHARGYCALVGSSSESYGWDILKKKCRHGHSKTKSWPYPDPAVIGATALSDIPDDFYCILDMDEGYLSFATNKKFLGVAFRGLKNKSLYPMVSAVWGHCEVTLRYLGGIQPIPSSLMEMCRRAIREQTRAEGMNNLDIPPKLKRYLHYT
ncbi:SPRY domain-containing protein [Ditylenchus destructor]|nr:SPRY domain-containing protein [Ditylenchus destructor]